MVRRAFKSRPKRRVIHVERLHGIIVRGIRDGWVRQLDFADIPQAHRRHFLASLAMDCEDPYRYTLTARYDRKCVMVRALFLTVEARCRKCENCRERRGMYWAARARSEYHKWPTTWMVTLTIAPEMHYFYDAMVRDEMRPEHALEAASGRLAPATLYGYRARVLGRQVTKYLHRLRKRSAFRYLLVAEAHENPGAVHLRPHFHILIHEYNPGTLVKTDEYASESGVCHACRRYHKVGEVCDTGFIRSQWSLGFSKAFLAYDEKSVYYLCKYMTKSMQSRVRASIAYGEENSPMPIMSKIMEGRKEITDVKRLTPQEKQKNEVD